MTSNLGSQLIQERLLHLPDRDDAAAQEVYEELRVELHNLLRQTIRPEFLNRIDEIILFRVLSRADLRAVIELQLKRVEELVFKRGFTIHFTDDAKEWLGKLGYDPSLGARPLKRVIQKHIINPLSEKILAGEVVAGDALEVGLDKRGLVEFVKMPVAETVS
jgi:ATP-dependent Clp protease ATP-binding subunit ClpB